MQEWQREWILLNGPELHALTEVKPVVLNRLCSANLLGLDDVDELVRIRKHEKDGTAVQKSEFYQKLMRQNCYDDLIKVLLECKLSGAANLLKNGYEAQGKLENVQCPGISKSFLFGKIPEQLSYYIPRSIRSRFVLSKEIIFQEEIKDVFLFTGIKPHELSSYLGQQRSIDKSGSQVKQMSLSVSHILLETKDHFQKICELAEKNKAVHWLHHENGKFIWGKSGNSGGMSTIQKATEGMIKENELFCETDFLAHLDKSWKNYGNSPVVVADTPGMGKSVLLQSLARQIASNSGGNKAVIFVVIGELIQLLRRKVVKSEKLSISHVEKALIKLTTESGDEERRNILRNLLQSKAQNENQLRIELMLDGYDEINLEDLPLAHDLFSLLRNSYPSARIWVATRPHLLHELETKLQVTGFTILSFDQSNQTHFLRSFWHSKICKSLTCQFQVNSEECSSVDLKLVAKVANHCLTTLATNCFKDPKAGDICGVPLQCLMLAEVFQDDCLNFVNKDNWTSEEEPTLSLKITSIKDLYGALIEVKLNKYAERYYSKELRPKGRVQLLNQHIFLGLQLLFPQHAELFQEKLLCSHPALDEKKILNVGLVEGALPLFRFIHKTIAEFLVARFVVDQLCPGGDDAKEASKLKKLFSRFQLSRGTPTQGCLQLQHLHALLQEEVLKTTIFDLEAMKWSPSRHKFERFVHEVVAFFLNSLLEGRNLDKCSSLMDFVSREEGDIVAASVYHNHFNIFKLFLNSEVPNHPTTIILFAGVRHVSLNFLKVLFHEFGESWQAEAGGEETLLQQKSYMLHCAVECREYSVVDYLLSCQGFSKLLTDFEPSIRDLLHALVFHSNLDPEWLLKEKLEVLERLVHLQRNLLEWRINGRSGETPLLHSKVHVELTLKLIELGADPCKLNDDKSTLLHNCEHLTGKEYHRIVDCLRDKDNVLNELVTVKTFDFDRSVLHQIAQFIRHPEKLSLEMAFRRGADFAGIDRFGKSCLLVAAENGNVGAARALLEFDAVRKVVNEKDKLGQTPLDILMTSKRFSGKQMKVDEFGKLLVSHGAKLSKDSLFHRVISEYVLDLDRVRFLLDVYKVNVSVLDDYRNNPLHTCMRNMQWDSEKRVEVSRMLLEKGVDVKSLNGGNMTPLDLLIRTSPEMNESCLKALSLLEEYGAVKDSPEIATQALRSACQGTSWSFYDKFEKVAEKLVKEGAQFENILLEPSALNGWTHGIRYILEKGVFSVKQRNERGETILHLYMSSRSPVGEVVEMLLSKGADIGATDLSGVTPLERGMKFKSSIIRLEVLKVFVSHGAAKLKSPELANKILFQLVKKREEAEELEATRFVETVISEGGDIHTTDEEGSSLLHHAAMNGSLSMVRCLVEKGVDVNVRNGGGMTPLHYALRWNVGNDALLMNCVNVLEELGADLEAVDNESGTVLHFAAKCQPKPVLSYFMEREHFNHLLDNDEFLLDVASSGNVDNLKELFSKLGGTGRSVVDVGRDSTDANKCSILHVAVKEGDSRLVKYLLESKLFVLSELSEVELRRFGNLLQICVEGTYGLQQLIPHVVVNQKQFIMLERKSRIIELLVDANKELVNTTDSLGKTCLHVPNVSRSLLQLLIEKGADVNCKDGNGDSVVELTEDYMDNAECSKFVNYLAKVK